MTYQVSFLLKALRSQDYFWSDGLFSPKRLMCLIFLVIKQLFMLSNNKGIYAMIMLSAWEMLGAFSNFLVPVSSSFVCNQTASVHSHGPSHHCWLAPSKHLIPVSLAKNWSLKIWNSHTLVDSAISTWFFSSIKLSIILVALQIIILLWKCFYICWSYSLGGSMVSLCSLFLKPVFKTVLKYSIF